MFGIGARYKLFIIFFTCSVSFFSVVSVYAADDGDAATRDSDGDGYADAVEIRNGYSPFAGDKKRLSDHDEDADSMNDFLEFAFKTDPKNPDSDGDGHTDGEELRAGYDPRTAEPRKIEKRIVVDISEQRLRYYWDNVELGTFLVSTGRKGKDTPVGNYSVTAKLPLVDYIGSTYSYPRTKWNLRFHGKPPGAFYIHGAYWHNKFGTRQSGGCVNVAYKNMEGLYHWADVGTKVAIVR